MPSRTTTARLLSRASFWTARTPALWFLLGACTPGDEVGADTHDTAREAEETGSGDTRTMDLGEVDIKIVADSPGDSAGRSAAGADVNGDGLPDLIIGARNDGDGGYGAGAAFVVWSPVLATMDLGDANGKLVGEEASDWTGWSVDGAGDLDLDGYDDVLVGAVCDEPVSDGPGSAFVVLGPASGSWDLADADIRMRGEAADDGAGISVAGTGDVDEDGIPDIIVGADENDTADIDAGAAYLVSGSHRWETELVEAEATLLGEDKYDGAGGAVAGVGDVDGDGTPDLLLGAWNADGEGQQSGVAYLVLGPVSGTFALGDADARLLGEPVGGYTGCDVAGAGDVDGDGLPELLIGAFGHAEDGTYGGAAYLVAGAARASFSLSDATARLIGEVGGDRAGYAVDGAGDVDADGHADLLVGADEKQEAGFHAGAAYLVTGPVAGTLDLSEADLRLLGEDPSDYAGTSVAGPGDTDGDGLADVLVGAKGDRTVGSDAGAVFLVRPLL